MSAKRILSIVIVLVIMLSCFTVSAFAAETEQPTASSTADEISPSTGDEEPQRLLGDVDKNLSVNVKDATTVQKHIAGLATLDEISVIYADADRNSEVNIKDATCIQKFVAGIFGSTSVGDPYVANPETNRYYFYMPELWYNDYTNTAGIYWWDGTNYCSWPGIPAKKGDAEGVFYYDVPKDVTTIIWNNFIDGGMDKYEPEYYCSLQTQNIGTEYYDPGESDLYPDGTDDFDNMIYIVDFLATGFSGECGGHHSFGGEWYYYYGNGEYGTSEVKGESEILTDRGVNIQKECFSCGVSFANPTVPERPPVEPEPEKPHPGAYRYYFYLPEEWLNESTATTGNTAGIYWWEGTDAHDGWPGVPANKADAEGVYYYDVPKDVTTIIWNNYFDGGADMTKPYYDDSCMTRNIGTEFYAAGESDLYPEGLENFDGMIYVIDLSIFDANDFGVRPQFGGEWYYYYGNGEYGTSPVRGESEILTESALNRVSFVIG